MPFHKAPIPRTISKGSGGIAGGWFERNSYDFFPDATQVNPVELGYVLPNYIEGQDAYVFGTGT